MKRIHNISISINLDNCGMLFEHILHLIRFDRISNPLMAWYLRSPAVSDENDMHLVQNVQPQECITYLALPLQATFPLAQLTMVQLSNDLTARWCSSLAGDQPAVQSSILSPMIGGNRVTTLIPITTY